LEVAKKEDIVEFKKNLQESFEQWIIENFGSISGWPIPSDKEIEESFNHEDSVIYHILLNEKKVWGIVVIINEKTHHNSLDFLFVNKNELSRGIWYKAWLAIEKKYPNTKIWETHTPYFEKRNIHFYVNKCGFKIVEFLNEKHKWDEELPWDEEFFRFEKVMKK
jgi:hypothetical protein